MDSLTLSNSINIGTLYDKSSILNKLLPNSSSKGLSGNSVNAFLNQTDSSTVEFNFDKKNISELSKQILIKINDELKKGFNVKNPKNLDNADSTKDASGNDSSGITKSDKAKQSSFVDQLSQTDEFTPDKVSDRIISGISLLYDRFEKQNPSIPKTELIDKFSKLVNQGVTKGYDDAVSTLENIQAFKVDGVKNSVEQTKIQIDSKLKDFLNSKANAEVSSKTSDRTEYSNITKSNSNTNASKVFSTNATPLSLVA